jgi:predicted outer membrane repeat protein
MSAGQGVGGRGSVCFVRRGLGGGGTRDRMLLALLAVLPPLVSVFGEIGAPCGGVGSKSLLLVVENPLDVSELADYAACDGIYINVTWANSVIIPKTIELGNGTSVNVRGEGEGAGALLAVVDGANKRGLFRVGPGATLELYNIQLRNGTVEGDGGCIHTQGGARVVCGKGCMMIGCRCMNAGGAVFLDGGSTLSMEDDASIMNSYSELKGGAIAAQERSSVVMSGTATVSWNQCVVDGGGLWLADESTLSMTESARISNNTIPVGGRGGGGAGIFGTGFSRIVMADYTSVSDNFIGGDGAGAYLQFNSSLSMHGHAQMARNYATAGSLGGGALSGVLGVTVTMHDDSSIVDNSARGSNGGAMYCWSNCSFTMADRTRVTGNIATNGGGFFLDYGSHLIMGGNSTISDNYPGAAQIYIESMVSLSGNAVMTRHQGSTLGGAVQAWSGSRIFLADNVQIIDNSAVYSGGGLFLSRGSLDASGNVTISGNSANSKGGGIYCAFCNISADGDFLVEDNSAGFGGGGMSLHLSTLRLSGHSILKANDAADVGGGLYATASDITLTDDVAIEDNFAGRSGGGAVLSGFSLINIKDRTRIMRNSAGTDGGGLSLVTSNVAIDGDTVSIFQNSAGNSGGGISMTMSSLQSKGHTVMAGNTAASSGGAIFMQRGVVEIQGDAVIRGNEADVGGGIFIGRESHLAVKDSGSFVENLARKGGGAIFTVSGAKLYLGNATLVSSNKAFRAGAGILHDSDATPDTIQISAQSVFEDNMSECCALQPPGRFPTTLVGKELSSCSDVDSMDNVIERVRGTYECCGLGEYPHPTSGACTKCQDAVDGIDCGSLASMLGVQVESLPLARGFWRATRSSLDIVKCRISGE